MGRNTFDQLFDQFFRDPNPMIKQSTSGYPITDIFKDDNGNQVIQMALAGFRKPDIDIQVKENEITISYKGTEPWRGEDRPQRRIAKRNFTRTFVDYSNQLNLSESQATFEDGLLQIIIPQMESAKPKMIEIR